MFGSTEEKGKKKIFSNQFKARQGQKQQLSTKMATRILLCQLRLSDDTSEALATALPKSSSMKSSHTLI